MTGHRDTTQNQAVPSSVPPVPPVLKLFERVAAFASLERPILEHLARVARRAVYASGEMLFLEGEPAAGLFIIEKGRCKVFKTSAEGREQIVHLLLPGQSLNDVSVFDGGPNPANAVAVDDMVAWVIAPADVKALAFQYPTLGWALLENMAQRLRMLVSIVEDLGLRPVKARLAKLLLEEAERGEQAALGREQMLTQQDIAARLGTVREMVGRALRTLVEDGAIKIERHRIVIANSDLLRQLAMM